MNLAFTVIKNQYSLQPIMKKIIFLLGLFVCQSGFSQLKIAKIFGDHVVLQRQKAIPVWGWANPADKITATLAGQTQNTVTDANGKWQLAFKPLEAGGPYELAVQSKANSLIIKDILIGEVWLCSGQSNMEWQVKSADKFKEEIKNADFPQIRHFYVDHEVLMTPQNDLKSGEWKSASAQTVGDFSAVGFFFARELYQKLKVPIGLINSSWGGSQVEGWISKEGLESHSEFKNVAATLPKSWEEADANQDLKLRKQLLGAEMNPSKQDEKRYFDADYDFSKWMYIGSPFGQWDWKGIWAFRGNGFMACNVEISKEMAALPSTIGLGIQDNFNEIYINGQVISAGVIKGNRKIPVLPNVWKEGKNTLMVKMATMIEPFWYGSGLMGADEDAYVSTETEKISLANGWKVMPSFADSHRYEHTSNNVAATIYNGMIAPLIPFAMRGSLWYQGETNAGRAFQYRQSFPLLISDWRNKWKDDFSFYFVQLATYGSYQNSNEGSNWAELREAQSMTLSLPKTGMAVTTDIGNQFDIHPTNKQDVGHRLALVALQKDYGKEVVASGPTFEKVAFSSNSATISFKNIGGGLQAKDKFGYLKGFEIAGEDKVFYYAKAEIIGDQVVVYHPKNKPAISVRYAWADSPLDANLFNADGLPASPFRTDNWPGITVNTKFQ